MTASGGLEMKIRGRSASLAPPQAICKVLHLETANDQAETRLNNLVHWGYGTTWGTIRSLVEASGIHGITASLFHFGLLWGVEQVMLPRIGVAPPITKQSAKEIAIDVWHHAVYVQATGSAYEALFQDHRQSPMKIITDRERKRA
jgi:hypothetical protein